MLPANLVDTVSELITHPIPVKKRALRSGGESGARAGGAGRRGGESGGCFYNGYAAAGEGGGSGGWCLNGRYAVAGVTPSASASSTAARQMAGDRGSIQDTRLANGRPVRRLSGFPLPRPPRVQAGGSTTNRMPTGSGRLTAAVTAAVAPPPARPSLAAQASHPPPPSALHSSPPPRAAVGTRAAVGSSTKILRMKSPPPRGAR